MKIEVFDSKYRQLRIVRNGFLLAGFILLVPAIILAQVDHVSFGFIFSLFACLFLGALVLFTLISVFLLLFGKRVIDFETNAFYLAINSGLTENGELFGVQPFGHFLISKDAGTKYLLTKSRAMELFTNDDIFAVVEEKEIEVWEQSPIMIFKMIGEFGPI